MENHAFAPERCSLSLCCDLSPHVQRRASSARLLYRRYWACAATSHKRTQRQTDTHAGYGIHRSSYVCAIINKSEIARLQTPRSEYQTSGAEGRGGEGRLNRALKEGVPNWQPSVPITRTAVTATRETLLTPPVHDNNAGSPAWVQQLIACNNQATCPTSPLHKLYISPFGNIWVKVVGDYIKHKRY